MPTTVFLCPKHSVKYSTCTRNQKQDKQIDCWVIKPLFVVLDSMVAGKVSRERANTKWIRQHTKCQQKSCCTQIVASNVPLALAVKGKTSRLIVKWANLLLWCLAAWRRWCVQNFQGTRQHKMGTTAYKCRQQSCCTQNVAPNVPLAPAIKSKTSRLVVEWANLLIWCLAASSQAEFPGNAPAQNGSNSVPNANNGLVAHKM